MLRVTWSAALAAVFALLPDNALPAEEPRPVPYFVSLGSGEVNLRTGPGVRYPIDWVYQRRAIPVEVIGVFDHWRQIRDWQGTEGWVHQNMLSTRRTLIVTGERRTLRREPGAGAPAIAEVAPGVLGEIRGCE
ncbi:MAG: SH3 domain-containing protein, partial [Pseudomonadota bacterium]